MEGMPREICPGFALPFAVERVDGAPKVMASAPSPDHNAPKPLIGQGPQAG